MKLYILIILVILPFLAQSQVKAEFEKQLEQDCQKNIFAKRILKLNAFFRTGLDTVKIDSLKANDEFEFMSRKVTANGKVIIILDVNPLWAETYMRLEREGKISVLKNLRSRGQLKLTSRVIANEVELPKKINKNQSYNDFYLGVIRQLMIKYKSILTADQLDYTIYKSWEKEADLRTELSIRQYRESFILFLYNHYKIK